MRDETLVHDLVLVDADMALAHIEDPKRLPEGDALEIRYHHFDHETAAGFEMRGDVLKARDLLVLRRQVHDRVEDEVNERERVVHSRRREVADRHPDLLRARLFAQPRDHRLREVDAVNAHATLRERERDASGADPELERGSVTRELREELHGRADDIQVAPAAKPLVVARGDILAEVIDGHEWTLTHAPHRRDRALAGAKRTHAVRTKEGRREPALHPNEKRSFSFGSTSSRPCPACRRRPSPSRAVRRRR